MKLNIYNNKQPGHNRFTLQIYSTYVKNNTKYETMTLTYLLIVNLIVHCPNNETVFLCYTTQNFCKITVTVYEDQNIYLTFSIYCLQVS